MTLDINTIDEFEEDKQEFSLLPKILNGGISGIIGASCTFPIDVIRTRLQTQRIGPNGEKMFKNMLDCFSQTYRAIGISGMFRGSPANIILVIPEKSIKLSANDYFRHHLSTENGKLPVTRQMVAGGLAGLFHIIITTPQELLKIQTQIAVSTAASQSKLTGKILEKPSTIQIVQKLLKENGIFGLYKGLSATMLRDVSFSIIYFPLFHVLHVFDGAEPVFWRTFLSGLIAGAASGWLVTPFDVVKTRLQAMRKVGGKKEFKGIADCVIPPELLEGKPEFILLPKIINGGIAGIIGVTCVFPIDLVKTRLQSQQIGPNGEKQYKNILDCFRQTYRSEGFFGMYHGSAVNILLITPEKAIKLAANDFFRYHLTTIDGKLPVTRQMVAGGLAGLFQIIVTTPMELLKIQMQNSGRIAASQAKLTGEIVKKTSTIQIIQQLLKEKGIFGLYKGLSATMLRDVSFSIIYFPLFHVLHVFDGAEPVFWRTFLSGLASGAVSGWLVTPFDVVKTRLQAMNKVEGEKKFKGIADCFIKTLKYEGVTALFKGGLCRMMVIAPLFGIAQMVYFMGVAEWLLSLK